MLLACAMLFSSVELTAFATEPGMETLQPGDESGTTGENEVTEEEDGTEDSDTEEDVDGTGGSEEDGTGEQTPEDEIDTGKEPGNPEQEGDAADGEEPEGEHQESNDPDKEDPSESDQTEDSDGTVEEEEDSDVTDGNDGNEEDGSTDDSGKTEEDDSVSENSVSENSVAENSISENSISENSLITVNAKSSFGRALTSTVPIEMTAAGSGSEIDKVIIDGMGAEVHLYGPAAENCMLVVGIYDEISERQIATANVEVSIGETVVSVSFEDTLPQYFIVRAFLVENDTYRPLCGRYESNDYTRTMQEFYNKTTADFAAEQIINLDESEDNNFVVFSDYVKVIRAGSDGTTNKVVACDEENLVYMIENPDETVTGLKAGETFAYLCDDNGAIITTIVEIIINEQNNLVEIHGSGENLNDVFEFIKIGACNPRNTMMRMARESALEGELKEVLKFSFDDEKIELGVRTTDDGEVETQPVKWEGLEQTINNLENLFPGIFGDDLKDSLKTLKSMGLSADLTVSAYTDGYVHFVKEEKPRGAQLVVKYQADIEIDYGNSETVGGNGDDDKNSGEEILKTPSLKVELPLIPSLPKEFLSVTAQIHFEMDIGGSLYILANVDGSAGLTVDLEKRSVEKIGGSPNWEVKIGAELEFEPKLVFGIDASFLKWGENVPGNRAAGIAGEIEAGATITLRKPDIEVSSNKQHECREKHNNDGDSGKFYCISGELVPLLGIEAEIDFVGFEFNIAEDFFDELEEKIGENNKIDFYCSFAFGDFGKGKCPHEKYKVTVKVKKNEVPVSGARVNDESDTSKNGCVERWESPGVKLFYAVKDGIIGNKRVKIIKPGQMITIYLRTGEAGVVEGSAVEQVCAGDQARSCAVITRDGRLYRWGDNCYGQIGDATLENRYEPVLIPLPGKVVMFMENNGSSAAVVQNGTLGNALYMWGRNEYGQLGNDTKNNVNVPPDKPLMDGVREVCLGNRLTAVIKETGELYLCGSISGQTMTTPTKVLPGQKIKQVATNQYSREGHIAAVTESGDLYLWGDNQSGQIGNGKNESNVLSPVQILLEEKVKQVSLGDGHSAAVTEDGRLYLWGG